MLIARHAGALSFAIVSLGLAVAAGCTLIAPTTAAQCHSQKDCLSLGPDFADTTCSADRLCVKKSSDERACTTNQECIQKNGGAPFTCRKSDNKCVALTSAYCPKVFADQEDLLDDNTIFVGMSTPLNPDGQEAEMAAELARFEIKRAGGLPPAVDGGPRRYLGIVACNAEQTSTAISQTFYKFLSENVQIPYAISGFATPDTIPAATHFIAHDILMTTQNSTTAVTTLDDQDLVFRLGFSDALTLRAQAPFLKSYLENQIRTEFSLAPADPVRVIILKHATDYGDQLEELRNSLSFNGKNFVDNLSAGNLEVVEFGGINDPVAYPNPDAERAKAVAETLKFKPHIVLIITSPPIISLTWLDISRQWPAGALRPYFIAGFPTMAPFMPPAMAQFPNEEARKKFFAMRSLPLDFNNDDFEKWKSRLIVKFPALVGQAIGTSQAVIYDGVYMFAYSLTAIKNAPINGHELSRGLRRVADASGGLTINWGTDDYSKAIATLSSGGSISYRGPIGSYGFDAAGDHPGNPEVFCFGPPPSRLPVSSGYSFDTRTQSSVGSVTNCN